MIITINHSDSVSGERENLSNEKIFRIAPAYLLAGFGILMGNGEACGNHPDALMKLLS